MSLKLLNILLAEDDQDDRTFFRQALKELRISANLTTVDDGDRLMEFLLDDKAKLPDVVFLDINMPRKNGFECLVEIKSNIKFKDLPIVVFSTSASHERIDHVFKKGAQIYIHKPNDFAKLKQLISHALPISTEELSPTNTLKYIFNA